MPEGLSGDTETDPGGSECKRGQRPGLPTGDKVSLMACGKAWLSLPPPLTTYTFPGSEPIPCPGLCPSPQGGLA